MKVKFEDDNIIFEGHDFTYKYVEDNPVELYKVLQLLIKNENDLEFELLSDRLIAKKFFDILKNEFCEFDF